MHFLGERADSWLMSCSKIWQERSFGYFWGQIALFSTASLTVEAPLSYLCLLAAAGYPLGLHFWLHFVLSVPLDLHYISS